MHVNCLNIHFHRQLARYTLWLSLIYRKTPACLKTLLSVSYNPLCDYVHVASIDGTDCYVPRLLLDLDALWVENREKVTAQRSTNRRTGYVNCSVMSRTLSDSSVKDRHNTEDQY